MNYRSLVGDPTKLNGDQHLGRDPWVEKHWPRTTATWTTAPPTIPSRTLHVLFLSQTRTCLKTKNSYRLKTCLTSSKIKLFTLFIGTQIETFPWNWSSAINRFEVIKNTFQSSFDQVCVKRCLIHLEGPRVWIFPRVRRYHWKMEMVTCHHVAS